MVGDWPLIGRAEELRLVEGALNGAVGYRGGVIAGQAGVGKSRLAHELLRRAVAKGLTTRWAVGTASARTVPLGALAAWCDRAGSNPLQVVHQLSDTFADTESPVVVAVDDAHLLDDLSAFVLHHLVLRQVAKVIVTIRTGAPAPDAITALWKDGYLQRLDLQSLSRPESDELLSAALGGPVEDNCALRMWRLTRGNALYLRHVVAQEVAQGRLRECVGAWHWVEGPVFSDSVADLIERQIGQLPELVSVVVDTVAVAEPVPTTVLTRLTEPAAVEDAEARGLICIDTTGPTPAARMAHPLYGGVRRARAGPLRLRRLRGHVATALAELPEFGVEDAVRRAVLRSESDLPVDPGLFLRAANGAMSLLDLSLAEKLAHLSASAGGGTEAHIVRAHALTLLNRADDAEAVLAAVPIDKVSDSQLARLLTLRAANMLWNLARPDESASIIDDALQKASPAVTSSLWAFRTVQLAVAGRPVDALELARTISLDHLPDLPAMCAIWGTVIAAGDTDQLELVSSAADTGYRLAASSQDASYQGIGLAEFHVAALLLAGAVGEAAAVADRTDRHCRGLPGVTRAMGAAISGMAALGRGHLTVAIQRLGQAFGEFEALGYPVLLYRYGIVLTQAYAVAGQTDCARSTFATVEQCRHPSFAFVESERMLAEAWLCASTGAVSKAIATARCAADYAAAHRQRAREVLCLQVATQLGDPTCGARLRELAAITDGRRVQTADAFASALADHDGHGLAEVSTQFETLGDTIAAADAAAHAALAFQRANLTGSALTLVARAHELAHHCGGASTPALRQATEMHVPLTPREREIVALLAQGQSNKEIAETLSMSVRTVEGHLYRARAKTGAHDRRQLGAMLREQ